MKKVIIAILFACTMFVQANAQANKDVQSNGDITVSYIGAYSDYINGNYYFIGLTNHTQANLTMLIEYGDGQTMVVDIAQYQIGWVLPVDRFKKNSKIQVTVIGGNSKTVTVRT
jgi:YbbR domain-containing protein